MSEEPGVEKLLGVKQTKPQVRRIDFTEGDRSK